MRSKDPCDFIEVDAEEMIRLSWCSRFNCFISR